jgi:hypothetical protein
LGSNLSSTGNLILNLINSSIMSSSSGVSNISRKHVNTNNSNLNENLVSVGQISKDKASRMGSNASDGLAQSDGSNHGQENGHHNSSLLDLSDSHALIKLIESIYKELALSNEHQKSASEGLSTESTENGSYSTRKASFKSELFLSCFESSSTGGPGDQNQAVTGSATILDELKSKKMSTNNWNQKIAIELVECKIKLRQLINEMLVLKFFFSFKSYLIRCINQISIAD